MEFAELREPCDGLDIVVIQGVPSIETHASLHDELSGLGDAGELGCGLFTRLPILLCGLSPWARVHLTHRKAAFCSRGDLGFIGIDKGTHRNSDCGELLDHAAESIFLASDIESAFGRNLLSALRNEHGGLGHDGEGDPHHLICGRHLKVQGYAHGLAESPHIGVLNMASILTQVHGDSASAAEFSLGCCRNWVWLNRPSCLADGCDMINIDTEDRHGFSNGTPPAEGAGIVADLYSGLAYGRVMDDFQKSLEYVLDDLLSQGCRVTDLSLLAVESYFQNDAAAAAKAIREDVMVDHVDVQIERACINLMGHRPSEMFDQRSILTIVKVNNELERIADCAVNIAEAVKQRKSTEVPDTLQVMANSVVGMVRDAVEVLRTRDTTLAQRVLGFDDTVDAFKDELVSRAQTALANGVVSVGAAMQLLTVVREVEQIADHCTNICEQVIYLETGKIVRHLASGWTSPALPEDD